MTLFLIMILPELASLVRNDGEIPMRLRPGSPCRMRNDRNMRQKIVMGIGQTQEKIYCIVGGMNMHLSKEELLEMEQINIKDAVIDNLVDITEIEINMKQAVSVRAENYVKQVGNPFLVRVGEYVVKIGYSDCQETLNDRMHEYIRKAAEIKY